MSRQPALVIALDFSEAAPALRLVELCRDIYPRPWFKIGLQLYTIAGPELLRQIKNVGFNVFLDLKFYDIPNTVFEATRSVAKVGADMFTIHLGGGEKMVRAAVKAASEFQVRPLVLGVTILTSEEATDPSKTWATVLAMARQGQDWGLDGVVCSAHEVSTIKQACGAEFICLTPGIRPLGAAQQDQARVMTPEEAVKQGSDFLVVGRPITQANDPLASVKAISKSIFTIEL